MLESRIGDVIGQQELLRLPLGARVAEAAKRMAERHVGAVLVCEGETIQGIFTERDMLERVVAGNLSPDGTLLQDVMTNEPASIASEGTLLQAIFAMRERKTRHLLVTHGGEIDGIVSVHDLLRALVDASLEERQQFEDLWEGFPV